MICVEKGSYKSCIHEIVNGFGKNSFGLVSFCQSEDILVMMKLFETPLELWL